MECLCFYGADINETIQLYDDWAKGKQLGRDVIIHSHIANSKDGINPDLIIVVFFDEVQHPTW